MENNGCQVLLRSTNTLQAARMRPAPSAFNLPCAQLTTHLKSSYIEDPQISKEEATSAFARIHPAHRSRAKNTNKVRKAQLGVWLKTPSLHVRAPMFEHVCVISEDHVHVVE